MSDTLGASGLNTLIWTAIRGEVGRLRGSGGLPMPDLEAVDRAGASLDEQGLGIDSLEQMGVPSALTELFGIENVPSAPTIGRAPTIADWAELVKRHWRQNEPALWLRSSGTTGVPRLHRHRMSDLLAEARFFADMVGPRARVLSLVPGQHIYGLIWTVLLPELSGTAAVSARGTGAPLMLPGDLVVGTAEHWRSQLRAVSTIPDNVIGVNAAAPLATEEMQAVLGRGASRMLDVYGSSETGGVGVREAPAAAYQLLPRWTFARSVDADVDERHRVISDDGVAFDLPDRITVREDGFELGARRDGVVQIGGHNVDPSIVASFLREQALVEDVAVRLGDNGRLKAFIVPGEAIDDELLVAEVARAAAEAFPAYARPVAYRVGRELPRNLLGKPGDWM